MVLEEVVQVSKIKNINFDKIVFNSGYWKHRYELNRDVSLKCVRNRFETTSRFEALRFTYKEGKDRPHVFFDSDVAKWIEAVAYLVKAGNDCSEELALCEELIDSMEKNQREDGYLNSFFQQIEPDNVFTRRDAHELYCAGHLLEAAIAYTEATGKTKFLEIMKRYITCIEKAFITEKTAKFTTPGHEEIELALLKMYEFTGDVKYLNIAMFFIDKRGTCDNDNVLASILLKEYDQNAQPVRELTEATGHAVRATYLFTAMALAGNITKDEALIAAAERLYDNITSSRMYITGGIGSTSKGEALTVKYDLPNLEAYSESCAAIALLLFSLEMQKYGLNAKYPAVIERILYNGLPSTTSIDGRSFFYQNPLEIHTASVKKDVSMAPTNRTHFAPTHRSEIFSCSCCPPNINRIYARIGDVFLSEYNDDSGKALVINQFAAITADTENAKLTMSTAFPADGKINISLSNNNYSAVYIRKPEWCESYTTDAVATEKDGYIIIKAAKEMSFYIDFSMKVFFAETNPSVRDNNGRVALCYGPTVYCLERLDNDFDLGAVSVDVSAALETAKNIPSEEYALPDIELDGFVDEYFPQLYRKAKLNKNKTKLKFRPYWTFANREECDMKLWIRGV